MPPVLHRLKTFGESVDSYLWLSDPIIARFVGPFDAGFLAAGVLRLRAGWVGGSLTSCVRCFVSACSAVVVFSVAAGFGGSSIPAPGGLFLNIFRKAIVLM